MTIEETTMLFVLWLREDWIKPRHPETVLLGGLTGLTDKIIAGMKENEIDNWAQMHDLANLWISENEKN